MVWIQRPRFWAAAYTYQVQLTRQAARLSVIRPPPFVPAHKALGPLSPRMLSSCSPQQSACWLQPRGHLLRLVQIPTYSNYVYLCLGTRPKQRTHPFQSPGTGRPCNELHTWLHTDLAQKHFFERPGFIYGLDVMTLYHKVKHACHRTNFTKFLIGIWNRFSLLGTRSVPEVQVAANSLGMPRWYRMD